MIYYGNRHLFALLVAGICVVSISAQESIDNRNEAIDSLQIPLYGGYRDVSRRGSWDVILGEEQRNFTADKSVREILSMTRNFMQVLKNAEADWDAVSEYFTERGEKVAQWELQRYFNPSSESLIIRIATVRRQQDTRWVVPLRLLQGEMEAQFTLMVVADESQWKVDDIIGHPQFHPRDRSVFSPYTNN